MSSKFLLARLSGILAELDELLADPRSRYFDPRIVVEYFTRFEPIRESLLIEHRDLLGDLPARPTPEASGTTDYEGRGYIVRGSLEQLRRDIKYILNVAAAVPEKAIEAVRITREGVFFSGERFDALTRVADIFGGATKTIALIDGYIGKETFDLLTAKPPGVGVQLLTQRLDAAMLVLGSAFKQQHGPLDVRESRDFHDRFVVVDSAQYYHFGASIKDLGRRGFMFSLIEEPDVVAAIAAKWAATWATSTVLL